MSLSTRRQCPSYMRRPGSRGVITAPMVVPNCSVTHTNGVMSARRVYEVGSNYLQAEDILNGDNRNHLSIIGLELGIVPNSGGLSEALDQTVEVWLGELWDPVVPVSTLTTYVTKTPTIVSSENVPDYANTTVLPDVIILGGCSLTSVGATYRYRTRLWNLRTPLEWWLDDVGDTPDLTQDATIKGFPVRLNPASWGISPINVIVAGMVVVELYWPAASPRPDLGTFSLTGTLYLESRHHGQDGSWTYDTTGGGA